jgi:hypothetical protein
MMMPKVGGESELGSASEKAGNTVEEDPMTTVTFDTLKLVERLRAAGGPAG